MDCPFDIKWSEASEERRARALRIVGYNGGVAAIRATHKSISEALMGERDADTIRTDIERLMMDGKW